MQLVRAMADDDRIMVVVMHDLNLAARWADRIAVLHQGAIVVFGTPDDVLTANMFADVYGVAARLDRSSGGYVQVSVDGAL